MPSLPQRQNIDGDHLCTDGALAGAPAHVPPVAIVRFVHETHAEGVNVEPRAPDAWSASAGHRAHSAYTMSARRVSARGVRGDGRDRGAAGRPESATTFLQPGDYIICSCDTARGCHIHRCFSNGEGDRNVGEE